MSSIRIQTDKHLFIFKQKTFTFSYDSYVIIIIMGGR